jgi:hypothetical protein
MARGLMTPVAVTDMSTAGTKLIGNIAQIDTDGLYIKTTGYDATNLIFLVERSSKSTGTGYVYVRAGSTAGNIDFEPGLYSTGRDFAISFSSSTGDTRNRFFFVIRETARFKDTDDYIKFDFSTHLSTASGTTHSCKMGAIYINRSIT